MAKKKFKVDIFTSIKELKLLGVELDAEYVKKVNESEKARIASMQARNKRKKVEKEMEFFEDSDETFSFIAGYTGGGAPYGVRWDEENLDEEEFDDWLKDEKFNSFVDKDDIPF